MYERRKKIHFNSLVKTLWAWIWHPCWEIRGLDLEAQLQMQSPQSSVTFFYLSSSQMLSVSSLMDYV